MGIVEIDAYNLDNYMDILGIDMAENVGRTGFYAFGTDEKRTETAIMWKIAPNEEGERVSDILLFRAGNKSLGKELLLELVKKSGDFGVNKYHITMDRVSDIEMGLLKGFGFTVSRVESKDVASTISDVQLNALNAIPATVKPVALNELTYPEFRQQLTTSILKNKRGACSDVADLPMRWYDQDLSCGIVKNGEVEGMFLIHVLPSGIILPVLLTSSGDAPIKDMLMMIRYSLGEALKKYPPDSVVRVYRRNADIKALTDRLFKEKRFATVFEGTAVL